MKTKQIIQTILTENIQTKTKNIENNKNYQLRYIQKKVEKYLCKLMNIYK